VTWEYNWTCTKWDSTVSCSASKKVVSEASCW
jgi:hypothetical protein